MCDVLQKRVNSRRMIDILDKVRHQRLQRLRVLCSPQFLKRVRSCDRSRDVPVRQTDDGQLG